MPYRTLPLVSGETYHVFNRTVAHEPLFLTSKDYVRITEITDFYRHSQTELRFSYYNKLSVSQRIEFGQKLSLYPKAVTILSYCFMPNHFHFLLRSEKENGITEFVGKLQNSYAKYFNTKTGRNGGLFESMYKAVRIENDEQLLHVCRYVHLNPLTTFLLKNKNDLTKYQWGSYKNYLKLNYSEMVDVSFILKMFFSIKKFVEFTLDQADYQRNLASIRHLLHENP